MGARRSIVAAALLAAVALAAVGCVTPPSGSDPHATTVSPYHGVSWQGSVNAFEVERNSTTFYGCSDHVGSVTVLLSPAFGGTDTSTGPFTVTITTPYEVTTELVDFAQPFTSTYPVQKGDCFNVKLSSLVYFPPGHCFDPPDPGCDPTVPLAQWDGADYTISW